MKETGHFTGFTPETFRFFEELEKNNCKAWFDEHKRVYETEVLRPLKALALALTPSFYEVDPQMEFRPEKMVSRIYRDIRFSHDKTPYKNHMWLAFQRPFLQMTDDWTSFPGYYIEIGKEGANLGMGLFAAKKKIMDRYREQIEYDPEHFREVVEGLREEKGFTLGGEAYKRPVKSDLPDYFQPWIQRKGIYLMKSLPPGERFFSSAFVTLLEEEYSPLHPLYNFFADICD